MIIQKLKIINCLSITLLLLIGNLDARGGGRGGGRGRGRGFHRGGGGGGFNFEEEYEKNQQAIKQYANQSSGEPYPSIYGKTFDDNGPPENSYIYNNYFRDWDSDKFLINSLFYDAGVDKAEPKELNKFYSSDDSENFYRNWNDEKDKRWRDTTLSPYFGNKLPGDPKTFPASAVVGAATAFGLVSLLPLNVPKEKPLMYCGTTDLIQTPIRIDDKDTYICKNKTIYKFTCKAGFNNRKKGGCELEKFPCDLQDGITRKIYCLFGTLFSLTSIFCNSTTSYHKRDLNNQSVVQCYEGELPKIQASFIPTTTPEPTSTEAPKPLSLGANVHILLLKLMGKSEVLDSSTSSDIKAWKPEAITIPIETTTPVPESTTTKDPFVWMEVVQDEITGESTFRPIPKNIQDSVFDEPSNWFKVYTTPITETTTKVSTTTQRPFIWLREMDSSGNLVNIPKSMIQVAELFNYFPKNWVKVPVTKIKESTTTNR